jgi:hypothetical protein
MSNYKLENGRMAKKVFDLANNIAKLMFKEDKIPSIEMREILLDSNKTRWRVIWLDDIVGLEPIDSYDYNIKIPDKKYPDYDESYDGDILGAVGEMFKHYIINAVQNN